jgi:hypothetical protein
LAGGLPVIAIRVRDFAVFAEKRRRRRKKWNIFADHRPHSPDLHAGSRCCCCCFSLLTVELFHTVSPLDTARGSTTVVAVSTVVDHSDVFAEQMRM